MPLQRFTQSNALRLRTTTELIDQCAGGGQDCSIGSEGQIINVIAVIGGDFTVLPWSLVTSHKVIGPSKRAMAKIWLSGLKV